MKCVKFNHKIGKICISNIKIKLCNYDINPNQNLINNKSKTIIHVVIKFSIITCITINKGINLMIWSVLNLIKLC